MQWENVLDTLWKEDWLMLRSPPQPDRSPDADPDDLDALIVAFDAGGGRGDRGRRALVVRSGWR